MYTRSFRIVWTFNLKTQWNPPMKCDYQLRSHVLLFRFLKHPNTISSRQSKPWSHLIGKPWGLSKGITLYPDGHHIRLPQKTEGSQRSATLVTVKYDTAIHERVCFPLQKSHQAPRTRTWEQQAVPCKEGITTLWNLAPSPPGPALL